MRPSLYISGLAATVWGAQATGISNTPPIRNIFTFPKNHFIENIAVRANSNLLLTSMSVPHLFSIDPTAASPSATIIHTFPNGTGLMGITELTNPDTFAIVTGIWDLANTRAEPGSLTVWTIDLSPKSKHRPPKVNRVTTIPHSTILNGIAPHPFNPSLLLAADSARGALWRINLATGAHDIAFASPLFAPTGSAPGSGKHLGINGLRSAPLVGGKGGGRGGGGGRQWMVNDTGVLFNPTSAAFGRGGREQEGMLYVTLGGRFEGMDLVEGGVVAVDLGRYW
jgi:hypothetical protein